MVPLLGGDGAVMSLGSPNGEISPGEVCSFNDGPVYPYGHASVCSPLFVNITFFPLFSALISARICSVTGCPCG